MSERNFFAELKRRNVYKVAVAYAVIGWLLIQIATQTFPFFDIPNWAVRLVVLAIIIGFPIALVLAWAFEMTPEGIARTDVVSTAPKQDGGRAWIYVVLIGAALSLGLFFLGRYTAGSAAVSSTHGSKSIAVLPLVNQSGDPAQEYFSDGLTEELINGLGQIPELRVIGRNSSFHFKGKGGDSRAVGQALGVAHLLEGSVRKAGERVRISVQLVDAANSTQRWSHTYDRELKDIFAVQEEIAKSVAAQLRVTLLGSDLAEAPGRPSNGSLEAYNAYLQGQQHSRTGNEENLIKALAYYDEALRIDPRYAEAYSTKSLAWAQLGSFRGAKGTEEFAKARAAAEAALAIKPDLPRARGARAYLHMIADWDLGAAERMLKGLDDRATTGNMLANVRGFQGRTEEAIRLQNQAVAVDPAFALYRRNLATRLIIAGRLDEAEAEFRKAVELQPQAAAVHFEGAVLALLRGQPETAAREAELETNKVFRLLALALAQAARGDRAQADAALESLINAHGDEFPFRIAGIYCYRQEPDKVFEWLERAFTLHDPRLISLLADPLLQACRADPRFAALCRKVGLPPPK